MELNDIEKLIRLFEASSLAEMKLRDGTFGLSLKKPGAAGTPGAGGTFQAPGPAGQAPATPSPAAAAETASAPETEMITSPIVGTFYRAPAPDAPPFVQVGSVVEKGKPLCVLEAMKSMNQFETEFSCEIVRVIPENGALVQFGTPLFEVRRI